MPTPSQMLDGVKRSAFERDRNGDLRLWLDTFASACRFGIALGVIFLAIPLGVGMGLLVVAIVIGNEQIMDLARNLLCVKNFAHPWRLLNVHHHGVPGHHRLLTLVGDEGRTNIRVRRVNQFDL